MEKNVEKIKKLLGRINLDDVDRNEDLMWFVADLWNLEKHLNTALYSITEKLKEKLKPEEEEYYHKLFRLTSEILKQVREQRTKHLQRIYYIKQFGIWCSFKHLLGVMMQAGEVAAKDIHMAIEKEQELKKIKDENKRKMTQEEIRKDWENVIKDLETSKFAHDTILLMKKFSEMYSDGKNIEGNIKNSKKNRAKN